MGRLLQSKLNSLIENRKRRSDESDSFKMKKWQKKYAWTEASQHGACVWVMNVPVEVRKRVHVEIKNAYGGRRLKDSQATNLINHYIRHQSRMFHTQHFVDVVVVAVFFSFVDF